MTDINDFQITSDFNLQEFEDPTTQEVKISSQLVNMLQNLRDEVGPLVISSGYRTKKHNTKVKGHKNSAHLYGLAADVVSSFVTVTELAQKARAMGFYRVIRYTKHVHLAVK